MRIAAIILYVVSIIQGKKHPEKDEHEVYLASDRY